MTRRIASCCVLFAILAPSRPLHSAEQPVAQQNLEEKEAEVRRLREELQRRETELDRLRRENERLRQQAEQKDEQPSAPARADGNAPSLPVLQASRPLSEIGEPGPSDIFTIEDLTAYFREEPDTANSRFAGRTFNVRGIANRFESRPLQRSYWLVFKSADPELEIRAAIDYPANWPPVVPAEDGTVLVLRGERASKELMRRGAAVVVRGRFSAHKNGRINLVKGSVIESR